MALLKCPECGKDVSEYADACPNCGCPMSKILEILTEQEDSGKIESETMSDEPPAGGYGFIDNGDTSWKKTAKAQQNDVPVKQTGQSQTAGMPICPTCGSTNVKKVSTTTKVINAALFGYYGNRRRKQFHCNDCGYEW